MLLSVKDLQKSFDCKTVLRSVSFNLKKGESLVIIGGSGSGKSVLIKCIIGLMKKDTGKIKYKGNIIEGLCYDPSIRFGMLFQSGALFDGMTIWENIGFQLLHNEKKNAKEVREETKKVLQEVELGNDVLDLYPSDLSGGMQKRVALARAIIAKPELIIFDEPTAGLDPIVTHTINLLIRKTIKNLKTTAITITHDMHSMKYIADEVAFLNDGEIAWYGPVEEVDRVSLPELQRFIQRSA